MIITQRSQKAFAPGALVVEDLQTVDPEYLSTANVGDAVVDTYTTSGAYYNYYVYSEDGVIITNATPEICDISALPYVSRISPGRGKLYLDNGRAKVQLSLSMTTSGGVGSTKNITGIVEGSLTDFLWTGIIEPMLTGDPATRKPLFNGVLTGEPTSYELNSSRIGSGFDFSGVPVWHSSTQSPKKGGALITRRHLSQNWHYHSSVGDNVKFRASDGTLVPTTVLGVSAPIDDMCVVLLSDLIPETVCDYPIVGPWAYSVVSGPVGGIYTIDVSTAGIWTNQFRHILPALRLMRETPQVYQRSGTLAGVNYSYYTINTGCDSQFFPAKYLEWAVAAVGGDSSSPLFRPLSSSDLAFEANIGASTSGILVSESLLNALIASADANTGVSTGLTVTVAPDPTL